MAAGGVAMALAAAVILFEVANWDKLAPGVTVLGIPVGGLSREAAAARVSPNVDDLLGRPLQIRYGERAWNTSARELGMRLDPAGLAETGYKVGREGNPVARLSEQFNVLVRGTSVAVGTTTDQAALDASLGRIARELERAPQDARLALSKDDSVQYTQGLNGLSVDVAASRQRLAEALASGGSDAQLVVRETQPAIPDSLVQPAREQLARMLGGDGSAPLTLTFARQSWPLERADVVKLLSIEGGTKPGQPATVKIDEQPLRTLAAKLAKDLNQTVQDARFDFNGGKLKVLRESREGRELDQAATVALIKSRLIAGERTAELPIAVIKPAVSSDDPQSLGIVERIDRGSTSFAGGIAEKQWNIKLAAERLNGVVVPPHGTFSFNKEVGPTTLEAGFKWGFGITSGNDGVKTVPSVAGGICQVATTLFQPVFWAGYALEERYWHLYWIPAYTSRGVVGLDVTVDADAGLDFKWSNPTDDYVLIQSAVDEGNLYFGLYGKKPGWKVQVGEPTITNRTPPDPKPVAEEEPTLPWGRTLPVETAREGFDVLVTRSVVPEDGGKPRELKLRSTYQPSRTVTLIGTAGKPANASIDEAIAKVLGTQKPDENKPVGDPSQKPETTGAVTGGAPAAKPTAVPSSQATPAPKPQATTAPAAGTPSVPKPTPTKTP